MIKVAVSVVVAVACGAPQLRAQPDVVKPARPCIAAPDRVAHAFGGELEAGERFEHSGGGFVLVLRPDDNPNMERPLGWHIRVLEPGRDDDLSQFTTPFSGPNARDLYPWVDASGRLQNVPGPNREFYFSPEVGRTIVWEDDPVKRRANTARIESYGRGTLDVLDYRLSPPTRDGHVGFQWIRFAACLSWPR
jgi:hypothetical protein